MTTVLCSETPNECNPACSKTRYGKRSPVFREPPYDHRPVWDETPYEHSPACSKTPDEHSPACSETSYEHSPVPAVKPLMNTVLCQ